MNEKRKKDFDFDEKAVKKLEALREILKTCDTNSEPTEIPFGKGTLAETPWFTLQIPEGYQFQKGDISGDFFGYRDHFQTTPLQIIIKSEPLVLISPEEHKTELRNSFAQTRGMMLFDTEIARQPTFRCEIPTLGGRQVYFPLYHETEVFSLRINFVGNIINSDEILEKLLASFRWKEFVPRFRTEAVDAVISVFEQNRKQLRQRFESAQNRIDSSEGAWELCQSYGNALFGCFSVLDQEMKKLGRWDVSKNDRKRLLQLGENFCCALDFSFEYESRQYFLTLGEKARTMMEAWKK